MWPESRITDELLARVTTGEPDAVDRLLDGHRDALRQVVRRRMDPAIARRVDASDIVQDVLFDASRRLAEYLRDPRLPFQLWLRQLAQDRLIDAHRRHRGAARRSLDREQPLTAFSDQSSLDLAAQLRDSELTPAAATIRRELESRLHDALERIDAEDREVLLLRHFEHLSNSEAAELLGLSPAAAGMRHLRAVRRLKEILAERG